MLIILHLPVREHLQTSLQNEVFYRIFIRIGARSTLESFKNANLSNPLPAPNIHRGKEQSSASTMRTLDQHPFQEKGIKSLTAIAPESKIAQDPTLA